jgi:hypothetical protein
MNDLEIKHTLIIKAVVYDMEQEQIHVLNIYQNKKHKED